MSLVSHNILATPLIEAVDDHTCPYAERVLSIDKQRELGLNANKLLSLVDEVAQLHAAGSCPPTHVNGSPTKEWSDLIRYTRE